jgi:glycosyltransferase involved in cell wall biosynthesis
VTPQDLSERPLRILTFGRYADDNFGGLERYVFELAHGLGNQAELHNIVAARGLPPDADTASKTVYARPLLNVSGTPVCPSMPLHALRLHRARPFDIVHLQFPADPMAHLSVTALPRDVKRVVTWHSDVVRQRLLLRLYRPFLRRLLRSARAIILPTPAHLTPSGDLARWAPSERLRVVPYGIDVNRFSLRPRLADELRQRHDNRFLIFALGRHVYYKGFAYLIEAMRHLPDAVLVLGGRGPLTDSLLALTRRLGLEDRVHIAGRIPEVELPAYYHACDVFCMPSVERAEAFGFVQVEAMACGKPVVCCELHNGVTWANRHGETGLVVPPRDAGALAGAIRQLQEDGSLRARLGAQARKRATSTFARENMASETLKVYRQVLAPA